MSKPAYTGPPQDPTCADDRLDFIKSAFVTSFDTIAAEHHEIMKEKGFWDNREKVMAYLSEAPDLQAIVTDAMDCQLMALVTTETSEAVEGVRHGNPPDDKIPQFDSVTSECADMVLRIMDFCQGKGLNLSGAIVCKMEMNRTRPAMHGGKNC